MYLYTSCVRVFPQSLACWSTRPFRACRELSPRVCVNGRQALPTRAPTPWTPSCVSSAPSTPPCASTAPTLSSSSRWWSSSFTSSALSHSTTCCYAKTCAPGAKACRSGMRCRCSEKISRVRPDAWSHHACLQVQCESAGGVAQRQRSDDLRSQRDTGASDPGRSAAAGEEEDWRGCRGHLLHVPRSHHCSGKIFLKLLSAKASAKTFLFLCF